MVFWFCEIVWLCLGLIVEFCFWVIIGGGLVIIDGGLVIIGGGLLVIELVLPAKRHPYLSSLPSHINLNFTDSKTEDISTLYCWSLQLVSNLFFHPIRQPYFLELKCVFHEDS